MPAATLATCLQNSISHGNNRHLTGLPLGSDDPGGAFTTFLQLPPVSDVSQNSSLMAGSSPGIMAAVVPADWGADHACWGIGSAQRLLESLHAVLGHPCCVSYTGQQPAEGGIMSCQ